MLSYTFPLFLQMAMDSPPHSHSSDCALLARARIRILRSEIQMNTRITAAHNEHVRVVEEVIRWLETNITRSDASSLLGLIPDMFPPVLRRQFGTDVTSAYTNNENLPPPSSN